MSGSGRIAPKPRKKSIAKPKAGSLAEDEKTFKSAEFVQDSDDDEEDGGEASIRNHHALPVKNLAARLSPEKKKVRAKPTPSLQKPAKRPVTHIPSLVIDQSGSDGEAGTSRFSSLNNPKSNGLGTVENNVAAKRLSKVAKSSMQRKSSSVSASDTGSSASGQDDGSSPVPAKRRKGSPLPKLARSRDVNTTLSTKPTRHPTSSDTDEVGEPGSNEDAETDAVSESGSETQSHSGSGEKLTVASDNRTDAARKSVQPRLPYAPPPGFKSTTISSHAASSHTDLFSPANLQGKQIWHITLPASIPLNSIQEVAKHSVHDGSAILSYKDADYGLIAEPENQGSSSALLLPSEENNVYHHATTGITKTLHLRQIVRLPSISHDVGADDAGTQVGGTINVRKPAEKPAPEQPEGLKMRFKPIGVQDSDDSDSIVRPRATHKPPEFRRPQAPLSSQSPKKRKHDDVELSDFDHNLSPQKLAKLDATAKSVAIVSPVKQTPQKKPSGEKGLKAKKGEGSGISSSKKSERSTEPHSIGKSLTEAQVAEPGSIKGNAITLKPTELQDINEQPSSSTVDKSSSPAKEAAKRKKSKQDNKSSDHAKAEHKASATTSGSIAKVSPNNMDKAAIPSSEPQTNEAKKPRRKHKTVLTIDEMAQDDRAQATAGASQPKVPVVKTKPRVTSDNLEAGLAKERLAEYSKRSEKSSSQPATADGEQALASSKSRHDGETPEERKKRREEKKRRKEARANAKA